MTSPRRTGLNSTIEPIDVADDAKTVLSMADENVGTGSELALASGKVIAMRGALGLKGMAEPMHADYGELARIVPEKSEAVAAAGANLLQRSGKVAHQITSFVANEMIAVVDATSRLAACGSPATLLATQGRLGLAWAARMVAQSITLGTMAMQSQHAAMSPFHRTTTANADRLSR
jgi:hypothetical protein